MNKTLKWVLLGLGALLLILVVGKLLAGPSDTGVKVAVEKATKRTIIETVNASGKFIRK